jgi:hypothetical protein
VYNLFSHKCQDLASFSLLPSHKLSLALHNLICKRHPRLALASCSKLNLRVVALGFCNPQYSNIPDWDRWTRLLCRHKLQSNSSKLSRQSIFSEGWACLSNLPRHRSLPVHLTPSLSCNLCPNNNNSSSKLSSSHSSPSKIYLAHSSNLWLSLPKSQNSVVYSTLTLWSRSSLSLRHKSSSRNCKASNRPIFCKQSLAIIWTISGARSFSKNQQHRAKDKDSNLAASPPASSIRAMATSHSSSITSATSD